jgi:hypothetical protein
MTTKRLNQFEPDTHNGQDRRTGSSRFQRIYKVHVLDRMGDYVVAVRTYKRPLLFRDRTLAMLTKQGLLDRLHVFVGSDLAEYEAACGPLRYHVAPPGGHNAISAICDYFPYGQRIVFLDDDLETFFRYDRETDTFLDHGLSDLLERGFANGSIFGFGYLTNKMWLRKQKEFRPCYSLVSGSSFGAVNEPELIKTATAHDDDVVRSVQYFKAGRTPYTFPGAGFKTRHGKNPGGLQSSGDRADTHAVCVAIGPSLEGWVTTIKQEKCGLWTWKLKPAITIKKMVAQRVLDCSAWPMADSESPLPHMSDQTWPD